MRGAVQVLGGIAGLLPVLVLSACATNRAASNPPPSQGGVGGGSKPPSAGNYTYDEGALIRGDVQHKQIALIFTGGDYGEGTAFILDTLKQANIKASFFVTGSYIAQTQHHDLLRRMVAEGHYLGPHSDAHPLYCHWKDRAHTLVTREFFCADLQKNIADLRRFGALGPGEPIFFIPPYEWFNAEQVAWARAMGVELINFTPGSGSNRDWAPEGHASFVPSTQIVQDILAYEQRDPHGLNGFLLLLHLGSQRTDKLHPHLPRLLETLQQRGYTFIRVEQVRPRFM